MRVYKDTKKRLEQYGEYGDSHDDILNKVLDKVEGLDDA